MADAIQLSLTRTFTGIETAETFVIPSLKGDDILQNFFVMPNVVSKRQINLRPRADKIVKKITACSFTPKGSVTMTDKELDVQAVGVQLEECEQAFLDTIFADSWLRKGTARQDMTGTEVQRVIEEFIVEGIRRSNVRNIWFGDSGDADADWNFFDGWWKIMLDGSASLSNNFDLSTVETGGALDTDAALTAFKSLTNNIDAAVFDFGLDLRLYITRGLYNNYKDTLRNAGTDFGTEIIIDGVPRKAFDGIPLVILPEWDADLADSGLPANISSALRTTSKNLAALSFRDNFIIGTDATGAARGNDAEIWFSQDNRTLRAVVNYKLGAQIFFLNLIGAAF